MKLIKIESFDKLFHIVSPLLEAHFKEVGNTAVYDLLPDKDKYRAIEANKGLIAIVALGEYEQCIGYSVNFLTPHVHYRNQTICYNDVLFVSKAYREGSAGGRLMKATVKEAKLAGASVMQWHAKPDTTLNRVLSKRAKLFEHVYAEVL